jgi:hypothetical protein
LPFFSAPSFTLALVGAFMFERFEEDPVVLADTACSKLSLTNELLRKFA